MGWAGLELNCGKNFLLGVLCGDLATSTTTSTLLCSTWCNNRYVLVGLQSFTP